MLITLAHVRNYKRVRDVVIRPEADCHLLLLGGSNTAGKTSVLDAIDVAIGGKHAQARDPVHHGADRSEIVVEFDGGALTVRRTINPDGETMLEVRGKDGAVKSPQALLDRLLGQRFLDPLQFLRLDAKEQRAALLRLIDGEGKLADLEQRRERIFEKRTEVGRDLKKAEGELARLPPSSAPGESIDVAALSAERGELADMQRAGDGVGSKLAQLETLLLVDRADLQAARQRVEKLERELAEARAVIPKKEESLAAREADVAATRTKLNAVLSEWKDAAPRRERLDADLARADAHNRGVFAAEAGNKRRVDAQAVVDDLGKLRDRQTKMLADIDAQKAAFLEAASLPVPGLGVEAAGITLGGVPFSQASGAERLRVAVALAFAASSELGDVLVRDAALLDDDSLRIVGEFAEAAGRRLWLERVGDRDPEVIVIKDGMVAP